MSSYTKDMYHFSHVGFRNIDGQESLTIMLLIQNHAKKLKMAETLANGYSSESTQRELSNEYQHDRV